MVDTYYGTNQQQLHDGGTCPAKDCVACSGGTGTDAVTAGKWILTGPQIRSASGVSCYVGTGGLTQQAMANGVKILTNSEVIWQPHYSLNRQQVIDFVRSNGPLEISILYKRILSYSFRNATTFIGGHGTDVMDVRSTPNPWDLEFLWNDPLADGRVMADGKRAHIGPQWVRADVILAAAEDRGGGVINVCIPPDSRYAVKHTASSTPLRISPSATAKTVQTIPNGTVLRVRRPVVGGVWTLGSKTGNGWWEVDMVNGKSVNLRYAAAIRVK